MKKLIAILATATVAGGISAFAQDWITVQDSGNGLIWDEFTTPGTSHEAPAGDVTVDVLWALTGTADPLSGTATTGGTMPSTSAISSLLSGGWTLMQNYSSGAGIASLGTVSTTTGGSVTKGGSIVAYNPASVGGAGDAFEFDTASAVASGGSVEILFLAYAGGSSWQTAADLGISGETTTTVGTTVSDPENSTPESVTPFGVATTTPEPTTLALAGLGGLSMLFLRRRKA
jgi:hypothetical protein